MTRRAETVNSTRQRIVEATVELHGSVGPAATTVMGIAGKAGVTRATIYRHFPDETALFEACSSHWLSRQTPPDPAKWILETDPLVRMRVGLADIYRFFRAGQSMLRMIFRDKASLPEELQKNLKSRNEMFTDILLSAFTADRRRSVSVRAAVGHTVNFWTWRSLCIDHGLTDSQAVELATCMVSVAAGLGPAR